MFCSTKATTADGSLVAKPCSFPAGVTNITRQSLPAFAAGPCDFSVETITEHHYRCSHTPCIECRRPKWRYDPTASKVRRIRDADRRGDRYTPAKRTEHDIVWKTQGQPDRSTTEYL